MTRKEICQLSQAVINKIAAGEVIERPASVVKELVENAIDAGATQIRVTVVQGGAELIRVVDNGHGIPAEELPLAVASHATSKIRNADDLFSVDSMGFRGEALASISQVSEFHIRSRVSGCDAGAELEVIGGALGPVEPCGCSEGTAIEVRRLFFNTPVRRKFMKTAATEMGHATEAIIRIALAHPEVHFVLSNGKRETLQLPPVTDLRDRIAHCFDADLAQDLIPVESHDEYCRLTGYVANPKQSRSTSKQQYLFLNGRHIRDRALQHALGEAYRGLLLTGRHPIAFLHLEIAPDAVDVNVHPTKLEVRFQDGGRLYKQLLGSLRNRFLSMDLTKTLGETEDASQASSAHHRVDVAASGVAPHRSGMAPRDGAGPFKPFPDASSHRREIVQWARRGHPVAGGTPQQQDLPLQQELPPQTLPSQDATGLAPEPAQLAATGAAAGADAPRATSAIQIHNRYLVTPSEDGMLVIDQHALHERILYEQLREQVLAQTVETQRLLVPQTVTLTPAEVANVLEAQELLASLGVEVAEFGDNCVVIQSYPAMLRRFRPEELVRQLADQLSGPKAPDARDLLDELLHSMSCKAAVKAGDPLSVEEIEALVAMRHLVQDAHHCPHGRPTALVFTQKELDRRFERT